MPTIARHWLSSKVRTHTERVYLYITRKCRYKRMRYVKRPLNIQITWVRKACRLTYKEARRALEQLVKDRRIEKWTVFDKPKHSKSYYRIPPVDKPVDNF